MRILLVKPRPEADQFGLAPFFQTEPLGLEYIAAALNQHKHSSTIMDMRFERRRLDDILKRVSPDIVGISCLHSLDVPASLSMAQRVKAFNKAILVVIGGHAASAYPKALAGSEFLDAVCLGEGETVMPALCDALQGRRPLDQVPSLLLRSNTGEFQPTSRDQHLPTLEKVSPPDRSKITAYQKHYCCLNYMPVWTLETGRGCPHRCKFCSVWQFYRRSHRFHSPAAVRADFENVGPNLFVVDDIFWADESHSDELARTLLRSPTRKDWMLVQSRADLVADNPRLLETWRPLSENFDIFFGFESPTRAGLDALNKDADPAKTSEAINVARALGYGVTGNFVIDPEFSEEDFATLWEFLGTHKLNRVGFTILTPLPGTHFFESQKDRLQVFDWSHYDLHHLLWQPRLPVERFFELYCETWRRSVLNLNGRKEWWRWLREVQPHQVPRLVRMLARTQRIMEPGTYLAETAIPHQRD